MKLPFCPEVGPPENETLLVKSQASVFGDGRLAEALDARAGVWTEACVAATVKDAIERGFRVVLVKDACGSGSVAMHQTGNRLYGGAVTGTDERLPPDGRRDGRGLDGRTTGPVPLRL